MAELAKLRRRGQGRALTVWLQHAQHMPDAFFLRTTQHGQAVVDQQRARRIKGVLLLQGMPETVILLCQAQ